MKTAQLLHMGWSELAGRGVQELRKRFDRTGLARERDSVHGIFARLVPDPGLAEVRARVGARDLAGAARLLFDRFTAEGPRRFFEGAVSDQVPGLLRARLGAAAVEVCAAADSIMAGRFDLLGYRDLAFGDPPDWRLDPVSGRRAPVAHWSEIDPLDTARVGDSKVVWELNRHQWLVRLGQAYRLTGDERYAERFAATVVDWTRANPPGVGINWASSLEVALRLISWCWALVLFRGSRALGPELFAEVLDSVADHAGHVERYLSHYFSPNTHLTGEALGLLYAGTLFPDLRRARRWQRLGLEILVEQFDRQVLADGVHFERSTCYQRYTVEIYLHALLLSTRNGVMLPHALSERLERMVDALLALRHPDGSMPQIGDADGGSLLPLAPRAPDDFRGLFGVAAAVFRRPEHAWAAGGLVPEALWLSGPAALAAVDGIAARPPASLASQVFWEGGYAVMRSGWGRRAHQLILDAGPLGCPVSAGHGHADLLSVQCAVDGEPIVVDPGTYSYADADWRNFFRCAAAHATVTVDGLDLAVPRGPFAWDARPAAQLRRFESTEALDIADAEHHAYERLADPVIHRRRVLWAKPRYWVIVDDLRGAARHDLELRFPLAPVRATVDDALWARATGARGALLIRPFTAIPLDAHITTGALGPVGGWIAPAYGRLRPAPVLTYRGAGLLPIRIATLLLPATPGAGGPPAVTPLFDGNATLVGLAFEETRETIRFDAPESIARS